MTDNYPTALEELRRAFIVTYLDPAHPADVLDARFDRFIAKVKADALRTEADRIERAATNITHVAITEHVMVSNGAPGLLRESADRIERGER